MANKVGCALLASFFAVSPAKAQSLETDILTEESRLGSQNSDVISRIAQEYEPVGGRIGSFFVYPEGDVQAVATSNVLARPDNDRSDVFVATTATVRLVRPAPTSRIALIGQFGRTEHIRTSFENTTPLLARASWRLGAVDASRFDFGGMAARRYTPRSDINDVPDARSPVQFGLFATNAGYTWVTNRLTISAGGEAQRLDFKDPVSRTTNVVISQKFRDFALYRIKGEVRYDFGNDFAFVSRANFAKIDYDLDAGEPGFDPLRDVSRDSNLWRLEAGVGFSRDDTLYGSVTAGYSRRTFPESVNRPLNSGGLSFSADLVWNVAPSTTLSFNADRSFSESASRLIAGYRTVRISGRIDQAIGRGLILSGTTRYLALDPIGNAVSRKEYEFNGEANYFLTRRYRLFSAISYGRRDSTSKLDEFEEIKLRLGLRLTL